MNAMRGVAVVVLAGCWSTREVAPVTPATTTLIVDGAQSGRSTRSPRRDGFPVASVWQGTYVCTQGLSSVTLTIETDRMGNATARYDFGPVPSNVAVPTGAYELTGLLRRQQGGGFTGEFEASAWIVQPANYFMVPISIETGDGKTMTGTIHHPSCSGFQTTRIE